MKAGKDRNTLLRFSRSSSGRRGSARGKRPGRKGVLQSAGAVALGEDPDLRPKISFLAISRGVVNNTGRDSPPKGRLETVELGVPSLFECGVKKEGPHWAPWSAGAGAFQTVSWLGSQPPHVAPQRQTPHCWGQWGPRRIALVPLSPGARRQSPESAETRAPSAPARPAVGCRFCAGGFGQASPSFSTKGSRCVAFFGVKPSPGQSEISAFFQEHGNTKGLRGEIVKRKPFSL